MGAAKNNPNALQQGTAPADLFSFKLNYNSVDGSTSAASPLYNGNIAETFWQTGADGNLVYRGYGYKYDGLNRLKDATYQKPGFSNPVPKSYDENLTYDKNGNIMSLKRNGDADDQLNLFPIDDLSYTYLANSNKLMQVTDAQPTATSGFKDGITTGDDYAYDTNGNITVDKNKNITSIVYNHLNLPTKIIFPTGNIVYFYNASGQKLQKVVTENATVTTTDYLGGYQYQNTVLQFFPTAEGYVKNTPVNGTNSYTYVFNYTDHLGNVRISYTKNPSTNALTILEENSYYPYGLKHTISNAVVQGQYYKYKYNGKELQDELGLNMYDYGARNYDPALGRWMNVDPLAEKYPSHSPYSFVFNNPMRFVDPTGMAPDDWVKKDGKWTYNESITSAAQATAAGYDDFRSNGSILNNARIGSGSTGDVYLGAGGDSHYATAEDYALANGEKSFGNSFWNDTQGGSYLYSGGFNYNSTYAGISGNHQFLTASGFNNTGTGSLPLALDLGGSVSGATGSISGRLGTSNFGAFGNANGSAFTLDGSISSGILTGEGSKFGAMLGANVGAYALKGEYSGGFSIGGISMQGTVGGSLGSAHIGINMGTHYNASNGTFNINFQENVGLGIGEKGAINISIPIPFVK